MGCAWNAVGSRPEPRLASDLLGLSESTMKDREKRQLIRGIAREGEIDEIDAVVAVRAGRQSDTVSGSMFTSDRV